jgi:hypothetical protein
MWLQGSAWHLVLPDTRELNNRIPTKPLRAVRNSAKVGAGSEDGVAIDGWLE